MSIWDMFQGTRAATHELLADACVTASSRSRKSIPTPLGRDDFVTVGMPTSEVIGSSASSLASVPPAATAAAPAPAPAPAPATAAAAPTTGSLDGADTGLVVVRGGSPLCRQRPGSSQAHHARWVKHCLPYVVPQALHVPKQVGRSTWRCSARQLRLVVSLVRSTARILCDNRVRTTPRGKPAELTHARTSG